MFSTILKITKVSDPEIITSGEKELKMRWVIGTTGEKQIALKVWNDLATNEKLLAGNDVTLDFRIESRESNGRYFTDLTITKIS